MTGIAAPREQEGGGAYRASPLLHPDWLAGENPQRSVRKDYAVRVLH